MKKVFILLLFILFLPCIGYASTGDVLVNCTFDEPGSTVRDVVLNCGAANDFADSNFPHGSIKTGGQDGKKFLNFYYPGSGEQYEGFYFPVNQPEVTLVYWERFDVPGSASGNWNFKSTRAYTTWSGGANYIGALMSRWSDAQFQLGVFLDGDLKTTENVTYVNGGSSSYCNRVSGYDYTCGNGSDYGAVSIKSSPGLSDTSWHKVRIYYKMPSTSTSSDGVVKFWIDDVLLYTITNLKGKSTWSKDISHIVIHPSDDFFSGGIALNHQYDDITIYEGYVPPQAGVVQIPLAPTGLKIIN